MAKSPFSLFSPFSQTIKSFVYDPVTNWQRFFNPEVNFNFNPQDAGVEAHVLSRVGSYGSQLSSLIAVIEVLVERLPRDDLPADQRKAIADFETLRVNATKAVKDFRGQLTVDDIVEAAKVLQRSTPGAIAEIREKLAATTQDRPAKPS